MKKTVGEGEGKEKIESGKKRNVGRRGKRALLSNAKKTRGDNQMKKPAASSMKRGRRSQNESSKKQSQVYQGEKLCLGSVHGRVEKKRSRSLSRGSRAEHSHKEE